MVPEAVVKTDFELIILGNVEVSEPPIHIELKAALKEEIDPTERYYGSNLPRQLG